MIVLTEREKELSAVIELTDRLNKRNDLDSIYAAALIAWLVQECAALKAQMETL